MIILIIIFIFTIFFINFFFNSNYQNKKYNKILFLDIDDTILRSDNMFIYFKENISSNKEIKLSSNDYKLISNKYDKSHFDFRDFDNPYLIRESILNSKPLTNNFNYIREHINNGWDLGILTARGEEEEIKKVISKWLKINLGMSFNLEDKNIYAVGDKHIKYQGKDFSIKKLNILINYWLNTKYDRIKLMDDNEETIRIIDSYLPYKFEYYLVRN